MQLQNTAKTLLKFTGNQHTNAEQYHNAMKLKLQKLTRKVKVKNWNNWKLLTTGTQID